MAHIWKEEKYPDGSLKARVTLLGDRKTIVKEGWNPPQVNPLNPAAQQRGGQQAYKWNYVNGQKHGVQEGWWDNGQQRYKQNIVNGQFHGVQEKWYPNGQQHIKWNYVNGQKHGLQEDWYRNGRQWYKENYANGQFHGVQEAWFENGQQEYKQNYVNGQQHGVQESWNENGQQQDNKYYLDDVEVSQQTYQSYIRGLAPGVQAAADFGERGLSGIIAGYLLP